MKRVMILTAGFGEGHNTAARNLRDALVQTGDAQAEVFDVVSLAYGLLNNIARKAYLTAINHLPAVWGKIYRFLDNSSTLETGIQAFAPVRKRLEGLIAEQRPDVILSTFPLYSFLLENIFSRGGPRIPLITVVTDSITINSVWYRSPSDFYIVPNRDTAAVIEAAGVEPSKIRADGFPVTMRFSAAPERRAPSDEGGRRVLFMVNFARREASALVSELLKEDALTLTVTVGRDADLGTEIEAIAAESGRKLTVVGWTERMPELLMESHLLISKAGGATVQEAIAACTPMIISHIVPGQEEGNARLMVENGCGRLCETTAEIVATVKEAFAEEAKLWREWEGNVRRLSKPAAADTIARFALEVASR